MNISPIQNAEGPRRLLVTKNKIGSNIRSAKGVSFGGVMSPANGFFKSIERNGFFMEFLIIDAMSCILPRTLVGLHRDKDKTGNYNYQAGMEELGREVMSGPTLNLIPMACAAVAINKMLPSVKLESHTIEGINNSLQAAVGSPGADFSNKEKATNHLAGQLFDDAFASGKGHVEYDALKGRFVGLLETASAEKPKNFVSKNIDKFRDAKSKYYVAEENFNTLVAEINNKFCKGQAVDNPHQIVLNVIENEKKSTTSHTFFEDFHLYTKDVLDKFLNKDSSKNIGEFLTERAKKAKNGRNILAGVAFFTVGGFLLCLPRIYQLGKTSPAQQSAQRAQGGANENS